MALIRVYDSLQPQAQVHTPLSYYGRPLPCLSYKLFLFLWIKLLIHFPFLLIVIIITIILMQL